MNSVLQAALQMSALGALLICALLAVNGIFRKKAPKWILYYAWIIVLVRLLVPFGLTEGGPSMLAAIEDAPAITAQESAAADEGAAELPDVSDSQSVPAAWWPPAWLAGATSFLSYLLLALKWLVSHLWVIWLIGVAGMLLYKVTLYRGFIRYMRAGMKPCDDVELLDRVAELGELVGVRKPVEVCVNPVAASAMLLSQREPCIVLPTTDLPAADLDYILLHELTHLKRKDSWYKWAMQIAVCLHWFNPLVHIMSREVNRDCELSCDEAVLKVKGAEAHEYGATLLRAMASSGAYWEHVPSVSLAENKELLKERMEIMARSRKSVTAGILCALLVCCVLLGSGCTKIMVPARWHASSVRNANASSEMVATGSSLAIEASSCPVVVSLTDADTVQALYDDHRFDVEIAEDGDATRVVCDNLLGDTRDQYIELRVPQDAFENIDLASRRGFLAWTQLPSANITGDFSEGAAIVGLPAGFSGSLSLNAEQSVLDVCSVDGFADCEVRATSMRSIVNVPSTFTREGKVATYVDGSAANTIDVNMDGGVLRLEDSDADARVLEYVTQDGVVGVEDLPDRIAEIVNLYTAGISEPLPADAGAATASGTSSESIDRRVNEIANEAADRIARTAEEAAVGAVDRIAETVTSGVDRMVTGILG